jgi:hypothetical protein
VQAIVGAGSMDDLRRALKEFTLNTQQRLEKERSELLGMSVGCVCVGVCVCVVEGQMSGKARLCGVALKLAH